MSLPVFRAWSQTTFDGKTEMRPRPLYIDSTFISICINLDTAVNNISECQEERADDSEKQFYFIYITVHSVFLFNNPNHNGWKWAVRSNLRKFRIFSRSRRSGRLKKIKINWKDVKLHRVFASSALFSLSIREVTCGCMSRIVFGRLVGHIYFPLRGSGRCSDNSVDMDTTFWTSPVSIHPSCHLSSKILFAQDSHRQ